MKFVGAALLFLVANLTGQTQPPMVQALRNFGNVSQFSPAAYAFVFGTRFGTNPKVFIGTTPCTLFESSDTDLSIQIPSNQPLGPATLTVQTGAGTSAPFSFTVSATSPAFAPNTVKPPPIFFFDLTSVFVPIATPSPGQRVFIYVDGVGPTRPPIAPQILIDGKNVPVLAATTLEAIIGADANAGRGQLPAFKIQIPMLQGGPHTVQAIAGSGSSIVAPFTILARGLFTSQTGLTFNAVQGGPALPSQSFSVLSGLGTLNFSLTTSTLSGGAWLSATPTSGTSTTGTAGAPIQISANPSGLALGTYYGRVTITSPDAPNSPQVVTVVLVVSAKSSSSVDRTGLIFVAAPGGASPPAQTITVFNPGLANENFTGTLIGTNATLFKATPATGVLASGKSQAISIQPTSTGLAAGVYTARLRLVFLDTTIRNVNLLLVVPATGAPSISVRSALSCTPAKLLPVFTQVGDSFSVPAAWPSPIEVTIVDDCGSPLNSGDVVLTFSNGDAPLRLDSILGGVWTATWPPSNPRASVVLTLTAALPEANITGTAQISGGVNANPEVPEVAAGGVVDAAAYGSPVAPGNLIAIFGTKLSATTAQGSVPFPIKLLDTAVFLDGQYIPLFLVSDGQLDAMIPYDLSIHAIHQLVVQRGSSLSVPQSVLVGVARPGVLTTDSSGTGQGVIYKDRLVDKNAPAKPGDTVVIYCVGLGMVNPPLAAGVATPFEFFTRTVGTLTATIGGKAAVVTFAGLTPGFSGLYQVNAVIPDGLRDNDTTTLKLNIEGQDSTTVTLAVRN